MDIYAQRDLATILLAEATSQGFEVSNLFGLGAVFLLVGLNGFFVAAEFALVSVRHTRIDQLVAEGKGSAKGVQKALTHLDDYIAATQLGITLASLALGWVGEPAVAHLVEPPLVFLLGNVLGENLAIGIGVAVAFTFITAMHIVLGELAPKSVALQRSETAALFIIRPLDLFLRIFRPFIWALNSTGRFVVKFFGLGAADEHSKVHSVEELEMLVRQSHKAGMLDAQEEILLRKVFEFDDKTARQIMMPRTEIVGVTENTTLDELVDKASDERFTRLPVYRNTLDQIVGVIHVKDLFPLLRERENRHSLSKGSTSSNHSSKLGMSAQNEEKKFALSDIIRPALNVPESMHVADLLTLMRQKKAHMAVVIDEYGGTAGIVTLEDVLEELVGEVQDEFDTAEEDTIADIEIRPDGSALVSGLVMLDTIEEHFGLKIPLEQAEIFDTIGGYVLGVLGRVPTVNDQVALGDYRLTVVKMDGLRVDRLLIERVNKKATVSGS